LLGVACVCGGKAIGGPKNTTRPNNIFSERTRKIWNRPRTQPENLDRTERTFGVKIFLARCARSLGRTESATTRVTTKSIYHQTYEIAKSLYSPRTATADRPRRESASGANTITSFVTQNSAGLRPARAAHVQCQRKIWMSCEHAWKICFEHEHFERKIYYSVELYTRTQSQPTRTHVGLLRTRSATVPLLVRLDARLRALRLPPPALWCGYSHFEEPRLTCNCHPIRLPCPSAKRARAHESGVLPGPVR
jgi:hypothetical protein